MSIAKQEEAHIAVTRKDENSIGFETSHRPGFENRNSDEDIDRPPSRVSSTVEDQIAEQESSVPKFMSISNPPQNKLRVIVTISLGFCIGFNDAAPGALLPHMEDYYNISYSIASLIWVSSAMGFVFVACLSHKIEGLGKKNSLSLGCALTIICYIIVSTGTKYPAIVVAYFFAGAGNALLVAQCNIFISRFDKVSTYLSFFHGSYGTGATISPLVATTAIARGVKWHYFYLILMGIMIPHMLTVYYSFRGSEKDLKPWDKDQTDKSKDNTSSVDTENDSEKFPPKEQSLMILALKDPITWQIAFFVLFYQGAEVAMGGWIVSFFLDYRNANPKYAGYTASGFWGGLTIGRLCLTIPLHKALGARKGVIIASIASMILVSLVWIIPHIIVEAVLIALAGIFIGPNYPLLVTYTAHDGLIPRKIQVVALTIMSAFGNSGGAIFPFVVGLISQTAGTYVVLPVFIGLYILMFFIWISLPNMERRSSSKSNNMLQRIWERIW
ncbi:hypothetical protein G9P44_003922 [Scheffersomyces stipitis]|nr:hypothetical protein G9P44_003922 [Scheffersomyces stipitis]